MLIASRANPKVKAIRQLVHRKRREETGLFLIEGAQLVREALQLSTEVTLAVYAPGRASREAAEAAGAVRDAARAPVLEVSPEVMESISAHQGAQGICAVARQRWRRLAEVTLGEELCWVVVNQIEHPGSLGTILRVSDAVGGAGVILLGPSADPYDPTAVRASLGAVLSQQLVRCSFAEFADWRRQQRCLVVGTSPAAATDYRGVRYQPPVVLVLGNERSGLPPEQEAICDVMVSIPMVGRGDSHHVAVAAAVVLYEVFSQQRQLPGVQG